MVSVKCELSKEDVTEPEAKRAKWAKFVDGDDDDAVAADVLRPDLEKQRLVLNPADCDLYNGLKGSALHQEWFAYCWSCARANVGIKGGKYCFGCKIISMQSVNIEDAPPDQQHVCSLGISKGNVPIGNLGETEHSFGLGGTEKFSNAGKFSDFREKFVVGGTIFFAVDLESRPLASIGFFQERKMVRHCKAL
ncbi:hypothetical protein Ddye_019401 [Dipteronia dyeriana]|uniref:Uncharacterized protein n=1 Tax=Dipteronia dyeriana TaxID=168575 RepID=A0AAD9WV16_9ROSI|nr:hypothetical protein Ddye_019401 [Dipteronia dyeriana]